MKAIINQYLQQAALPVCFINYAVTKAPPTTFLHNTGNNGFYFLNASYYKQLFIS